MGSASPNRLVSNNVEANHPPQTPRTTPRLRSPPPSEPGPRNARLRLSTLGRRFRGSPRVSEDGDASPTKPRRESVFTFFSSAGSLARRSRRSAQSVSAEQDCVQQPPRFSRRRSLSDLLGTITNKGSPRRSVANLQQNDLCLARSQNDNCSTVGIRCLTPPCDGIDILLPPASVLVQQDALLDAALQIVQDFKDKQTDLLIGSRRASTGSWHSNIATLTSERPPSIHIQQNRSETPDSYLALLIDSAMPSPMNHERRREETPDLWLELLGNEDASLPSPALRHGGCFTASPSLEHKQNRDETPSPYLPLLRDPIAPTSPPVVRCEGGFPKSPSLSPLKVPRDFLEDSQVDTSASCSSSWKGPEQSIYPCIAREQLEVPLPEHFNQVKFHERRVAFQLPEIDYELRARNRDQKERKENQLPDACQRSEVLEPHTDSVSDPLSPPTTEACTATIIEPTVRCQAVDSHILQTLNHYELPWTLSFGHPSIQSRATGFDVSAAETHASPEESRVTPEVFKFPAEEFKFPAEEFRFPAEEFKPSPKTGFPPWTVRVEFPPISCPSHIAVYESMEEAAIAIINLDLSWYAIYDPKERYIYARSPDAGESDKVLLESLGLEVIWLPGYLIDLVERRYPWLMRERFEHHHQEDCTNDGRSFCLCYLFMKTPMKKSYSDVLRNKNEKSTSKKEKSTGKKEKSTSDTSPTDDPMNLTDEPSYCLSGTFMELLMEATTSNKEESMACMVDLQDELSYCLSDTFMELFMEENTSNKANYMTEMVNTDDDVISQLLSANEHDMIDKCCESYSLDESDENYSVDAKRVSYMSDSFLEHLMERRIVVIEEPRVLETCVEGKSAHTPLKADISPPEWAIFNGQIMSQSQRRKKISPKWPTPEQGIETLAMTTHPRAVNMSFDVSALRVLSAEASPAWSTDVGLSDTTMSDLKDRSIYFPSRASFKYGEYRPKRLKESPPKEPADSAGPVTVNRLSFEDILRGMRSTDEEFVFKSTEDDMDLEEGHDDFYERRCDAGCSNHGQPPSMPIGDVPSLTAQQPAIPSSPTVHVKWKKVKRKKLTSIELSMEDSTTAAPEKDVEITLACESLPYIQFRITDIPVPGQGPENTPLKAVESTECHVKLPSGFSFSEHASIMEKEDNSSRESPISADVGTDTGVIIEGRTPERVLQPVCVVQALQARGSLSSLHRMSPQISLNRLSPKSPSITYVGFDGAICHLEPDTEDEF